MGLGGRCGDEGEKLHVTGYLMYRCEYTHRHGGAIAVLPLARWDPVVAVSVRSRYDAVIKYMGVQGKDGD